MAVHSPAASVALCAVFTAFSATAQVAPRGSATSSAPVPTADMGDTTRPILISGSVVMEDGSALPRGVAVKSICGGVERVVAYPHADGKVDFRWGDNNLAQPDATQSDLDTSTAKLGMAGISTKAGASLGGVNGDRITNCELGVNLAGDHFAASHGCGRRSLCQLGGGAGP